MPEADAHSQRACLISKHHAHGTILIDNHVARTQGFRKTLPFIVNENGRNAAIELRLGIIEPIAHQSIEKVRQFCNVSRDSTVSLSDSFNQNAKQVSH